MRQPGDIHSFARAARRAALSRLAILISLVLASCAPRLLRVPVGPRALSHVERLAAPAMTGRGIGTPGLDRAADYIRDQLAACGVEPAGDNHTFFQPFRVPTQVHIGTPTRLEVGSEHLALERDWMPLGFSENGAVTEAPVVFAGYGIQISEEGYDDYAGLDAKGRVVLALRGVPRWWLSSAGGKRRSHAARHAALRLKAHLAEAHGARGLLIVAGPRDHAKGKGTLRPPAVDWTGGKAGLLVAEIRRPVAAALLAGAGTTLEELQRRIDDGPRPASQPLATRVTLQISLGVDESTVRNVVGRIRGRRANGRVIILGAHYDHLGYGGPESLDPGAGPVLHPGADDNASGVAAVIEIACLLARARPDHTVLVAAFAAEETGLLGSTHFVRHLPVAVERVRAMLNFDMVGRMRDRRLIVLGAATAEEFPQLLGDAARGLDLAVRTGKEGIGPSDQTPFYADGRPVLHFFTGAHADYHRPSDTADKINARGLETVVRYAHRLIGLLDARSAPLTYRAGMTTQPTAHPGDRDYGASFGIIPEFGARVTGVRILGTRGGSPAERAGLKKGDTIVTFDGVPIANLYDLAYTLQARQPGDRVSVDFRRNGALQTVEAVLEGRDR